jgi:hypothetical protein
MPAGWNLCEREPHDNQDSQPCDGPPLGVHPRLTRRAISLRVQIIGVQIIGVASGILEEYVKDKGDSSDAKEEGGS